MGAALWLLSVRSHPDDGRRKIKREARERLSSYLFWLCSELFSNGLLNGSSSGIDSSSVNGLNNLFYYSFLDNISAVSSSFLSSLLATARSHTGYESNGGKIE